MIFPDRTFGRKLRGYSSPEVHLLPSGIDLYKRDLVIGIVDPTGSPVEQRRLRASAAAVLDYFGRLPGPHRSLPLGPVAEF